MYKCFYTIFRQNNFSNVLLNLFNNFIESIGLNYLFHMKNAMIHCLK